MLKGHYIGLKCEVMNLFIDKIVDGVTLMVIPKLRKN
jgi:hypothetical protein